MHSLLTLESVYHSIAPSTHQVNNLFFIDGQKHIQIHCKKLGLTEMYHGLMLSSSCQREPSCCGELCSPYSSPSLPCCARPHYSDLDLWHCPPHHGSLAAVAVGGDLLFSLPAGQLFSEPEPHEAWLDPAQTHP